MKKNIFLIILFASLVYCNSCMGQAYNMSDTVITTCSGNFYDSGGPGGNYTPNENLTMTFVSSNGNTIKVDFTSFITVYGMSVYDGSTTNAPLVGNFGSGSAPFTVQSTGTSITFRFNPGSFAPQAGWVALISCVTTPLPIYTISNGFVTSCNGVFYDSGGADSTYTSNQNFVMSFCPITPNDYLIFNFPNQFELGLGDTLFVYSGTNTLTAVPIGVYTSTNLKTIISSPQPGVCVTFKFVSDGFGNAAGWQGFVSCSSTTPMYTMSMVSGTIPTCGGTFYDSGGPAGNYDINSTHQVTFTSANGNTIKFDFTSFITVYSMSVYDGNTTNAPLIGNFGSGSAPFIVQSTGTSITFRFNPGSFTPQAGWVANISCSTPILTPYALSNGQTITACSGIFYDDGGADSAYSSNQNSVMTFCPTTANDYLIFSFPRQFELGSGDTLFVFSGSNTSSAPIGVYVGLNEGTYISSPQPGACVTFKFVSDGSSETLGWQGIMSCSATVPIYTMSMVSGTIPTCGGIFYDSGGPAGNYDINSTHQVTFTSANGNTIKFDFTSFITVYGMSVYDGNTINAPLIGNYGSGSAPFTVQSTGTSITFRFTTGNFAAQAGWVANISCSTPILTPYALTNGQTITACSGIFYDDGGTDSAYSSNQNSVMTFCPATPTDYLVFNFARQFELGLGDTLFVYSGSNTSSTSIGVYVGTNRGAYISSPAPGACITFKFVSDGFDNSSGWQGIMSCSGIPVYTMNMISGTIPTCGGFFYDSGGPANDYKLNNSSTVTFNSSSGCAIKFDFGSLTTTYGLNVYDGVDVSAPLIGSFGSGLAPFTVQSTGSSITFEFTTGSIATQAAGWGANISCPTTTSAAITSSGTSPICSCDSMELTANSAASYLWSTGDTIQSILVNSAGSYFVSIVNNVGCSATSSPFIVNVNPLPPQPIIIQNGILLTTMSAASIQWYINDTLIIGATSNNYTVTQNGIYTVAITDSNGCSNISAPLFFNSVGLTDMYANIDFAIIPNPNDGRFKLLLPLHLSGNIKIYNVIGELIYNSEIMNNEIILTQKMQGIYLIKIETERSGSFIEKLIIE
ncbi:MAG: T9SS type A sorting domain-containing protein [Bacteroidia bacterium]